MFIFRFLEMKGNSCRLILICVCVCVCVCLKLNVTNAKTDLGSCTVCGGVKDFGFDINILRFNENAPLVLYLKFYLIQNISSI